MSGICSHDLYGNLGTSILFIFLWISIFLLARKTKTKALLDKVSFRAENLPWIVIIPILLVFLVDFIALAIFNYPLTSDNNCPAVWLFALIGFLQPIAEEFAFRVLFFGIFFMTALDWLTSRKLIDKTNRNLLIVCGLITQAVIFMYFHEYRLDDIFRLTAGLLNGFLYVYYRNNPLPAVTAHISNNMITIISNLV